MKEKTYNFTIFLMKEHVTNWKSCIKTGLNIKFSKIKEQYGLDGVIGITDSNAKPPKWKELLQKFTEDTLEIDSNVSNKAIMLVKINDRIMAITFGYGRAFLREESIEKNFGFIAALNLLDPQKIRSINSATVEDMVVHVQKQSSYSTGQEEFAINTVNDIMMSVTGKAQDTMCANNVSGKDSLVVSVEMSVADLKEKLEMYLDAYESEKYKENGFSWVDNIREVRDSVIRESLDFELVRQIENQNYHGIQISPPDTVNWKDIKGFALSGMGKKVESEEQFEVDICLEDYFQSIRPGNDIYRKLKRDKLFGLNGDDQIYVISSVFSALTAQIEYEKNVYILCDGRWFHIENDFYHLVKSAVARIPVFNLTLPKCDKNEDEGKYNEKVSKTNQEFCLMDKRLVAVNGGSKKIEACDIFTAQKQFVHVKSKCRSSQLSHLFAQGRISAECFISDQEYRRQVAEIVESQLGKEVFDYRQKPNANEFEVVYIIIDNTVGKVEDRLPFFSLVNLMLTIQDLDRMHMKYSIKMVEKEN